LRLRGAIDYPLVGVALSLWDGRGRLSVGAIGPKPSLKEFAAEEVQGAVEGASEGLRAVANTEGASSRAIKNTRDSGGEKVEGSGKVEPEQEYGAFRTGKGSDSRRCSGRQTPKKFYRRGVSDLPRVGQGWQGMGHRWERVHRPDVRLWTYQPLFDYPALSTAARREAPGGHPLL